MLCLVTIFAFPLGLFRAKVKFGSSRKTFGPNYFNFFTAFNMSGANTSQLMPNKSVRDMKQTEHFILEKPEI